MRKETQKHSKLLRGPPRKPKQSGHAIWVGNLPVNTSIIALKDHFAKGFTLEIESVFLMSKSNCAFVNYSTEKACSDAAARFHNSRFMGTLLACRIRTPLAHSPNKLYDVDSENRSRSSLSLSGETVAQCESPIKTEMANKETTETISASRESDRFFIMKSLTVQDLVLSVQYGIWITQYHNEELLNRAYEVSCLYISFAIDHC
jgi:RNA recognition motif-containing protein